MTVSLPAARRQQEVNTVTLAVALVAGYALGVAPGLPVFPAGLLLLAVVVAAACARLRPHLPASGAALGVVAGALLGSTLAPAFASAGSTAGLVLFQLGWLLGLAFACAATGASPSDLWAGWGRPDLRWVFGGVALVLGFGAVRWLVLPLVPGPHATGTVLFSSLLHRALAALADEYMFRGLVLGRFLVHTHPAYAVLAQATIYALARPAQALGPLGGPLAFAFALATGHSVVRTRGLGWAVLVHLGYVAVTCWS